MSVPALFTNVIFPETFDAVTDVAEAVANASFMS